jgi:hypothetical protein
MKNTKAYAHISIFRIVLKHIKEFFFSYSCIQAIKPLKYY